MGYTSSRYWKNKEAVLAELRMNDNREHGDHVAPISPRRDIYKFERWAISQNGYLTVDLIGHSDGFDGGINDGEWGYKDMSATMGVYYYNCPERLVLACDHAKNFGGNEQYGRDWLLKWGEKHGKLPLARRIIEKVTQPELFAAA